jgi:hypothetical protein
MELGGNRQKILELQSVAGKILGTKELQRRLADLTIDFARAISG